MLMTSVNERVIRVSHVSMNINKTSTIRTKPVFQLHIPRQPSCIAWLFVFIPCLCCISVYICSVTIFICTCIYIRNCLLYVLF